jgi:aerobic-type carbon monoxide dehydrogenase small subunit (CoxS/CutS family)
MSKNFHTVTPVITTDEKGNRITTVLIDGMEIMALTDYTISHYARGLATVTIEFHAEVQPEPMRKET